MLYDFIQLDRSKASPLWLQLYEGLRQAIQTGKLSPGEKLASIRQTCNELSVSRTTVETAYGRLCMEGLAESQPQSGYRVRSALPQPSIAPVHPLWKPRYDFGTSSIDPQAADLENWKKLMRAVLGDSRILTSYGDPQGEPYLREQLSRYAFRARGVKAGPDCIFIGAGVGPLLQLLCPLFPEKPPVFLESPGFSQAEQIFRDYGFPIEVPGAMDRKYGSPSLPESGCCIAAELPSLRPKMTSSAAALRRSQLSSWVQARPGRYILEDDYNGELRYKTRTLPAFQGSCPEKTIYLGSFSKLLIPSVRIAYMVLPPDLAEKARQRLQTLNQTAGKTEQLALAEYIRLGLLEKHLRRLRRLNARKSQALLSALEEVFGSRADNTLYETHLAVVMTLKKQTDPAHLCDLARDAGIRCHPSPGYFETCSQITLGFSGIREEEILSGIIALGKAWEAALSE